MAKFWQNAGILWELINLEQEKPLPGSIRVALGIGREKWLFLSGKEGCRVSWAHQHRPHGHSQCPRVDFVSGHWHPYCPILWLGAEKSTRFVRVQSKVFINWRHCGVLLGQISQWLVFPSFLAAGKAPFLLLFKKYDVNLQNGKQQPWWLQCSRISAGHEQIHWPHSWGLMPQHFRVSTSISQYFELGKSKVCSGYVA